MSAPVFPGCIVLAVAGIVLAGCTQFESVKDRFTPAPPQSRVVRGEPRQVYDAARLAMEKIGYQFANGGPAQGRLEGISAIARGGSFGAAEQRSITISLRPAEAGQVEVRVLIKETIERDSDRSTAMATEESLRDPAPYERFFGLLEQLLKSGKPG